MSGRADFAHVENRIFIEIEGGIFIQGRHNRSQDFAADAEKYLEAALEGWRVLRLTPQ
jgi:very-short-patch-repair endonuclease